ncbi:uncharacterized protein LOC130802995 [Amaranthus tricolor]|uniref:uncharacterized protein LOC130802995 n=1 Tax=Amaranthus tricolor TaxID=29722 RepID=UPI0025832A0D|nr:uncharacterized protein LOC130802995 [Amaranthus tricolor]
MEDEENETVILKLLIDSKTNKVLFAESGKDFVDFLFHIMSLPVGTIIRLLTAKGMVGCLGSLYNSIETLSTDYFQPNLNKNTLLKPTVSVNVPLLSLNGANTASHKKMYLCCYCRRNYTDCSGVKCKSCNQQMSTELNYIAPPADSQNASSSIGIGSDGYVKGVVTYMVMDNLEVKPMSTISSITLMNKFGVKDVSLLVEKEVQVRLNEGLAMLKASMETNIVLTTVFLRKKRSI